MPIVTVVVPVYKVEPYLHRCVDTILAQTFTDFELILVDDGSPDGCGQICDEYAKIDSRIHVIHQNNGGLSAARNAGIDWAFANSTSEWITFIDSDDWVHSKYLEAMLKGAKDTGIDLVICNWGKTEGSTPNVNEENLLAEIWNPESFLCQHHKCAMTAWGKIYKTDRFQMIRYPIGKLHEDAFVTYKILFGHDTIAFISEPLYAYYINQSSITGRWNTKRLDEVDALNEQISFFQNNGYIKAEKCTYGYLLYCYANAIFQMEKQSKEEYALAIKKIRKELRHYLIKFHKLGIVQNNTKRFIYQVAYPIGYPIQKRIRKKINNISEILGLKKFFRHH